MRRISSLAVAAASALAFTSLGASQVAQAADIPQAAQMTARRAPAPAAYNWTGLYAGINGGYGWGNTRGNLLVAPPDFNFNIDGGTVGGQIGYNHQIANWVFGIEVDYNWADISGSNVILPGILTVDGKIKSFGTVRGRLGHAWDRTLIYGTGGWAWGRASATFNVLVVPISLSDSQNHGGWTLGGGLEYAFAPNVSAKIEYLHVRLSDKAYFTGPPVSCTGPCNLGAEANIVRVGLNVRFGGARP